MPMQFNNLHHRKSIRLKEYNYSLPGEYFITICTYKRDCLFGEIIRGEMHLNPLGLIVQEEWLKTQIIRPEIELDEFIIMPNHLHGIIVIKDEPNSTIMVGTHGRASLQRQPRSLGGYYCRNQICSNKTDKRRTEDAAYAGLATTILRADHPERQRFNLKPA